jgi:TPR repeat protein
LTALKSSCLTPLPLSYIKGKGVKQDDFKTLKFYQKACGLNDGSGCSQLGLMYEKGIILFNTLAFSIHKSKKRAATARIQITRLLEKLECFETLKFYQKACGLNDGSGCSQLGLMYEKGKGVKQKT